MRLKGFRHRGLWAVLLLGIAAAMGSGCGSADDRDQFVLSETDTVIGDVDVAAYCRDAKESSVSLYRSREGADAAFDNWHCDPGSVIDLDDACRFEFGDNAVARVHSRDNAATWQCVKAS